jgi:hypothetical protein
MVTNNYFHVTATKTYTRYARLKNLHQTDPLAKNLKYT